MPYLCCGKLLKKIFEKMLLHVSSLTAGLKSELIKSYSCLDI